MRCLGLIVLSSGCLGAPPREPTRPPPVDQTPAERVLLGGTVEIETSWKQTCSDTRITGLEDTSSHDAPGIGLERETTTWDCKQQTFHVDVSCDTQCEADDHDAAFTGASAVRVRLLALGPTTVHLEAIHAKTNEHKSTDKRVEVVLPDRFGTQCMTPPGRWGACAEGLSAASPLIRVWPMVDNKIGRSSLLRVNGKAAETSTAFMTGVSLATLVDGPIQPGPYELAITLGDKQDRITVDVK